MKPLGRIFPWRKPVFYKENLQVPLTAHVYLEQTEGVYESGAGHLLIFRRCGPDLSGPDQTLQTSQQRNDRGLSRLSTCMVSVNVAITNHLTGFSRRNFSPHFPRECLKLEKLRTPPNTVSHRCYFVQHPASPAPCPTTFLQGPSTLRHRILEFSSRNSPDCRLLFSLSKGRGAFNQLPGRWQHLLGDSNEMFYCSFSQTDYS